MSPSIVAWQNRDPIASWSVKGCGQAAHPAPGPGAAAATTPAGVEEVFVLAEMAVITAAIA
jgi:hypothetical protein